MPSAPAGTAHAACSCPLRSSPPQLAAELRQGSPSHLRKVHSPRTAQQICKMLKLGDAAYSAWEEWQRAQPGGRNGGRRAAASPSPRKQPKVRGLHACGACE